MISGFLPVYKCDGVYSRRLTSLVSSKLGKVKTGHSGTLDPLAEGILTVAVGGACKAVRFLPDTKIYIAEAVLGVKTDSGDITGTVSATASPVVSEDTLKNVLCELTGEIIQTPPVYSAIKKDGKPLYEYARKNIEIDVQPRSAVIDSIELLGYEKSIFKIKVCCRKGTYIRTLCEDIGEKCGTCATMISLERQCESGFDSAQSLDTWNLVEADRQTVENSIISTEDAFSFCPAVSVADSGRKYYLNGGTINSERISGLTGVSLYRVYGTDGTFFGLGELNANGLKGVYFEHQGD